MAYTKEAKSTASHSKSAGTTETYESHLFPALLCEDGSYLLQEDGLRINLEWHDTKVVKPAISLSSGVKPTATWTK